MCYIILQVLGSLDHNLLLHLALGHVCLMYDLGSRDMYWPGGVKGIPRAIWWGVEWTRFALSSCWKLVMPDFVLRGNNVAEMFRRRLLGVSKKVKKKLRYYRTYLRTDRIHFYGVYRQTFHDNDSEFYRDHLWNSFPEQKSSLPEDRQKFVAGLDLKLPQGMAVFFHEAFGAGSISANEH
mmetsp:Transcript_27290/g.50946  ORF Transcript_27290/g.50946 Transcript_27290/m.50946 type:complete len:180 (-) Transcript_27290:86-625(-)